MNDFPTRLDAVLSDAVDECNGWSEAELIYQYEDRYLVTVERAAYPLFFAHLDNLVLQGRLVRTADSRYAVPA